MFQPAAQASERRAGAARKLKMARLLGGGGLEEEARQPLLDGALALARALAVEQRLPEPGTLDDALVSPLSHRWGAALDSLRAYLEDRKRAWQPLVDSLDRMI